MRLSLVVIRHAKPIDDIVGDDKKSLSEEGKVNQKKVVLMLKDDKIFPDVIYTSPILRAVQTAKIIASELSAPIEKIDALGTQFDEDNLFNILSNSADGSNVFFVGHAPTLADFANRLVGSNALPDGLPKSSAARIDFDKKIEYGIAKFIKLYTV